MQHLLRSRSVHRSPSALAHLGGPTWQSMPIYRCRSVDPANSAAHAIESTAIVAGALAVVSEARSVVLVEGDSDRAALETLAIRSGTDLAAEGISIVSMGGATPVGYFIDALGPNGSNCELAGLCDEGEEGHFRRALEALGLGPNTPRSAMEELGFFVCVPDLEVELIRCLGAALVLEVVESAGELDTFRTFQNQRAWRDQSTEAQLRRFLGTRSGRKIRYGRLLVEALDLARVPRPLEAVLTFVSLSS